MKIGNNETLKASCIVAAATMAAQEPAEARSIHKIIETAAALYRGWLEAERAAHTHDLSF